MSTVIPCDISDHNIIGHARKSNFQRFPAKLKSFRDYKKYDINEFHKMGITVLKTKFEKSKPTEEIIYRNYKNFDNDIFIKYELYESG